MSSKTSELSCLFLTKVPAVFLCQVIPESYPQKETRNAMQQCHARLYYYRGKGNHQEVPESFPEHPFDRGFHFPDGIQMIGIPGYLSKADPGSGLHVFRDSFGLNPKNSNELR